MIPNFRTRFYGVVPAVQTSAYADGDVLFNSANGGSFMVSKLAPNGNVVLPSEGAIGYLQSVWFHAATIAKLDLVIANKAVALGSVNGPATIPTFAESDCPQIITLDPASAVSGAKFISVNNLNMPIYSSDGYLYVAAIAREAHSPATTDGYRFGFAVQWDNLNQMFY